MKLAAASLNQNWENKSRNLDICREYIQKASSLNVDLIIFPEMTLTGFSNNIYLIAENYEKPETILKFSKLAKEFNIAIVFGVVIKNEMKALNKSIFVDNHGNVIGDYSKIHPFSFSSEDRFFISGDRLCIVKFKDLNIGLTICYDLRFPELYSALAKESDIIINIANWPKKRVDHWNTLLKARAIENQIFMIGVNRIGVDGNGLEYIESSQVFDANGQGLKFEISGDMKLFDIDKAFTKSFKDYFNTINDRKVELYKEIL